MRIANISGQPHEYVSRRYGITRYKWASGETLDVPKPIADEILEAHPWKFQLVDAPPATAAQSEAPANEPEEDAPPKKAASKAKKG